MRTYILVEVLRQVENGYVARELRQLEAPTTAKYNCGYIYGTEGAAPTPLHLLVRPVATTPPPPDGNDETRGDDLPLPDSDVVHPPPP